MATPDALPARRIVFVHAHPDDETIGTGATMAHYVAEGAHVTLVTCTLGEVGEIHVPEFAQLASGAADQLGGYRIAELRDAMAALGVTDHRFLGGAGRYRDSGMMGTADNTHPRAFWGADLTEAARHLVAVLREVRPQVLVTYDPNGFYGHPDHIQAHRVAMEAVRLAADPDFAPDSTAKDPGSAWQVSKVYWTTIPRSSLAAAMEEFRESSFNPFEGATSVEDLPFGVPDEEVTACVDGTAHAAAKFAAVKAHATQIPPDSWLYVLASAGDGSMGIEHYHLATGERGPGTGPHNWEPDLFSGL